MPAKQLLTEGDNKFRLLFIEHPQPMWIIDPAKEKVVEVNAAAARLYGYSQAEFVGKPLAELMEPDAARSFVAQLRGAEPPSAGVWSHLGVGGRRLEIEVATHHVAFGGGDAVLAILVDLTSRTQLEEMLRQAQKMEAVGMLAGGIAHDFNNLLTIINGYSQMIVENLAPDDRNRHAAEQIFRAGERAAALTHQLLAFSRRQVMQPKVIDLNQLVTTLSGMLQRLIGEDVELRLSLHPGSGRVNADPGQIEQVLMNLAVNARDAMPTGGVLTIETADTVLDERYMGRHLAARPGAYVLLAISDTGMGMDATTRARVFEPFFTTKAPGRGTGLGLSTVFGIVKQSGGVMDVYSEPGLGTSFRIYFPSVDQPVHAEDPQPARANARGSETVLVVEDDDMVRNLVRETLQIEGYHVIDQSDPLEAERLVRTHKGPLHLLITDVVMPKLSGRELADRVVGQRPGLKVLYMSGYTDNAVVNSGLLTKEVAFLQKPFTPGALARTVREVLDLAEKGDGKCQSRGARE